MDPARFNEVSAHVSLGVLGVAAAMFAMAWVIDRRPADGVFSLQAIGSAIAFPGYTMGVMTGLGRWEIPSSLVLTGITAVGAVEFTRYHLGRPAPPRLIRWSLPAATLVVVGAALAEVPEVAVVAMLVVSWLCVLYAIAAHLPMLRQSGAPRDAAVVILIAWTVVALGSGPRTLHFLGLADPRGEVDPLPAASAVFAALHAFVLVSERARALRETRALSESLAAKLATIEHQSRELIALDAEVRRQIRQRADDLVHGSARLLSALRKRGADAPVRGASIDGRYVLEEELGHGGMGVVHAARRSDGTRVALKLLRNRADAVSVARFAREARLAAQVRHPNVVRVEDLGLTDDGLMYLVLELIDGPVLKVWSAGRPPAAHALTVAAGIAEGLAAIHELGIVHRDLKPSNVILTAAGIPKISDFGIAALADRDALLAACAGRMEVSPFDTSTSDETDLAEGPEIRLTLTAHQQLVGTPMYMAPELCTGDVEPSPAADVYALGLVVFELLVGQPPFGGAPARVLRELADPQRAGLREVAGDVTADAIARCLSLDIALRPTASEIASILHP